MHLHPKLKRKDDASFELDLDSNSLAGFDQISFAGDLILTQMAWNNRLHSYHLIVANKICNGTMVAGPVQEDGSPVGFSNDARPMDCQSD